MQWVRAFLAGPSVHISQRKFIVPFQTFIFQEKTGPDAKAFSETYKSFRVCSAGPPHPTYTLIFICLLKYRWLNAERFWSEVYTAQDIDRGSQRDVVYLHCKPDWIYIIPN
jgi:hypothetical protein